MTLMCERCGLDCEGPTAIPCANCGRILRWENGPIDDDDPRACQCGAPCEEEAPCLVCGEPTTVGEPCDCLAPTRIITLRIEVRAPTVDDLPTPDDLRQAIEDGLHEDYYSRSMGDPWYIWNIGYPGDLEAFEDFNCPEPEPEPIALDSKHAPWKEPSGQERIDMLAATIDAHQEEWADREIGSNIDEYEDREDSLLAVAEAAIAARPYLTVTPY